MAKKRIVIIGGGFAGSLIAKKLENKFKTILIDNKDYFEYTPGILKTIVKPTHIKKIQVIHNNYLKSTSFIKGNIINIDKNKVYTKDRKLFFDYLIIASGSNYKTPIKHPNVLLFQSAEELKNNHKRLSKSKEILIIGGGIVGIELAAEIVENYPNKKITLAHSSDRLMPRENIKASIYTKKYLEKKNVDILLNKRVEDVKEDLAFFCTGVHPNSQFMIPNFKKYLDEKSFIKTNKHLQLKGHENIFVAGDVTDIKEEKLAQSAEEHAKIIIKNIQNLESNQPLEEYNSKPRIKVISLGKYKGIICYNNLTITGIFPAILKSLI